ncbi:alanine racemase [Gordonia sp. X0973]|nr:alanine racemase [Gordonia sp. X0973]
MHRSAVNLLRGTVDRPRRADDRLGRVTSYPQLRLSLPRLESNLAAMAAWSGQAGVGHWPHIKTTMCQPIVSRQLAAGATGVTVATPAQAATAASWGCRRILIANEVVDAGELRRICRLTGDAQIMLLVDSAVGVAAADDAARETGVVLDILLDVGRPGGRSGVRDLAAAAEVAGLVHSARGLRLIGVSAYEGVVPASRDDQTLRLVDDHCALAVAAFVELVSGFETGAPVFTAGGSAFPDRVVAAVGPVRAVPGAQVIVRSGCYVVHDHGMYRRLCPVPGLAAAVTVRGEVLSVPEPGLLVVGAGKRDMPHDADLPSVIGAWDPHGRRGKVLSGSVEALYDHHAVLRAEGDVTIGDLVDFGVSHPCGAFDRWPLITVVDADGRVVDEWATEFSR